MEPHAVPQDILNAEFKLFGGFTLKQFLKLLMACLAALFVFMLGIPLIIKIPIIFGFLIIGIGMATMPRFGNKLENYIKAIFISPRYVWVKEDKNIEVFSGNIKKEIQKTQTVGSSVNRKQKIDLSEISLDALLSTGTTTMPLSQQDSEDDLEKSRNKNFNRLFDSFYQDTGIKQALATNPNTQNPNLIQRAKQQNNEIRQNQANMQVDVQNQQKIQPQKSKQEYITEINNLKSQLNSLVRDENYREKENDLLSRINDLMHELKLIDDGTNQEANPTQSPQNNIVDFQGKTTAEGQIVFGIVVDKQGNPVPNAEVLFDDVGGNRDILAVTDSSGKFASKDPLILGDYTISIKHPSLSFNHYKITVGKDKLPAYKLRAR